MFSHDLLLLDFLDYSIFVDLIVLWRCLLKTQIIVELKSLKIICLASGKGKVHDFRLFQNSGVKVGDLIKIIADKGYQGIAKIHKLSETPIKRKKGKKLSKQEKDYNRLLNRLRIVIEHVNRRLKIFRILSSTYRNRHRRFGLRANLIAGIYNYGNGSV